MESGRRTLNRALVPQGILLVLTISAGLQGAAPVRSIGRLNTGRLPIPGSACAARYPQDSPVTLELGKPVDRELSAGQRHTYPITLSEGQYIGLEIKQHGIEVGVSLKLPEGKSVPIFVPFGNSSVLSIPRVAEVAGTYQFEVYAGSRAPAGRYEIQLVQLHPATDQERALQQARTLLEEYTQLRIQGKFAECRELLVRAIDIREKVLGPDDILIATPLTHLASLYDLAGDFAAAEPLFLRAVKIEERALGSESPQLAFDLQDLGVHYQARGDNAKAEETFKRAIEILEKAGRADNLLFDSMLGSLGLVYYEQGDYAKAEEYYARSQAMEEKMLGPDHFHLAPSYTRRGRVAYDAGDYAKAEAMFARALALYEKSLGTDKVELADRLNDLAGLYCTTGEYAKAGALMNRALSILERTGSMAVPVAQETLFGLSRLYAEQGLARQAVRFETQASELEERYVRLNVKAGSEREKLAFLATLSSHCWRNISLHAQFAPGDPEARTLAVTTILRFKGRVQDTMSDSLASLRERFGTDDRKLLDQLNETTSKIADLVIKGPQSLSSVRHQEQIKGLEQQKEELEAEISRRSSGFYERSHTVTLEEIQSAIPGRGALIEYAMYRPFDPKAPETGRAFSEPRYIVYVIHHQGEPLWAELGEERKIDQLVDSWRRALRDPHSKDVQDLGRAVDDKVMRPVRRLAGDVTQLLISGDGELNLAPFEAMVDEKGRYLIQNYSLSYLTSGRELLRLNVARESRSKPVIIANPLFGEAQHPALLTPGEAPGAGRRASVTEARSLSDVYFGPLAQTEEEARSIQATLPDAQMLLGAQATKSALKRVAAPRILHIATHGFFLETGPGRGNDRSGTRADRVYTNASIENPLLRSGLALAGANLRERSDDGILTALEASGLNLWGTKLVTLSACDTGLGEVKAGEGVYGMRRAFVLAGAESLVMSLWPVSDYVTREMMTSYYAGLEKGLGRGEALRRVKLAMLKRKDRQHPFFWASFIQSGEWANLSGKR